MPRKRRAEANLFVELAQRQDWARSWEFVAIDDATEAATAEVLAETAIFVSLAEREGFGLPGLEAIAAGCSVIGFSGGGGDEYFQPPQAFPVPDGDVPALVEAVGSLVTGDGTVRVDPSAFSDRLDSDYSFSTERRALLAAWSSILDGVAVDTGGGSAVHLSDAYDLASNVRTRRQGGMADELIALESHYKEELLTAEAALIKERAEVVAALRSELGESESKLDNARRGWASAQGKLNASVAKEGQLRQSLNLTRGRLDSLAADSREARQQFFDQLDLADDRAVDDELELVINSGILAVPLPNGLRIDTDPTALGSYLREVGTSVRNPHPLLVVRFLLLEEPRTPLVASNPLSVYLRYGAELGLSPHPLFDARWYLATYDDVRRAGINPLVHYLLHGWREGRDPNALFSSKFYLRAHRDVRDAGLNPLIHYVTHGWRERRRFHPRFDPNFYLDGNADVAAAGMDPLVHYLTSGRLEGRPKEPAECDGPVDGLWPVVRSALPIGTSSGPATTRVGIVSGASSLHSHVYRVEHLADALTTAGIEAFWVGDEDVDVHETKLVFCDLIVLFRTAWSAAMDALVAKAHRAGVVVLYDIDDYVFDEEVANLENADGIRFLTPEEQVLYHEGVRRYRRMLELCDGAIVTTRYLADRIGEIGFTTYLLPNGYSSHTRELSAAAASVRRSAEVVRLGYASGTKTHQRDFAVMVDALTRLLDERPNVVVTILGELDLSEFPELERFGSRIEHRPSVSRDVLPLELARFDLNLAPLEIGNPYCEAKSELKWFEAALVGVPTLASGTEVFASAIEHDRTGMLAFTASEWLDALRRLVTDETARTDIAASALRVVHQRYGPETHAAAAAAIVTDALQAGLRDRSVVSIGRPQRLTVLLPGVNRGSGGHGNILSLAKVAASAGRNVHCVFEVPTGDFPEVESIIEHFDLARYGIAVSFGRTVHRPSDAVVATYWTTVEPVIEAAERDQSVAIHFVQDYESWFFSMGTSYLQARDALHRPTAKIAWGRWMADFLRATEMIEADHIDYPLDHDIYYERPEIQRAPDHVLFFARPDMPRRCFDLVMAAVRVLCDEARPPSIVLFGSDLPIDGLPEGVTNVGVLGLHELADLYRHATIGVAFSPTNPSNVPFEMMACGLPVIDIDLPDAGSRYGRAANAALVRPTAQALADEVLALLADDERREQFRRSAALFVKDFPTRNEIGEQFVRLVDVLAAKHRRR